MNKKLRIPLWVWKTMRVTFQQVFLFVLFCAVSFAHNGAGQHVLEKKISLNAQQIKLRKALSAIEAQAQVRFIYSSSTIDIHQKVNINANNKRLDEVLTELLAPASISHTVVENRILLKKSVLNRAPAAPSDRNGQTSGALDKTVKGRVTDDKGEPLPGVSVLVKGTQSGTTTDIQGNFVLDLKADAPTLIFSFVGYLSREIAVGDQTFLEIGLTPDTRTLEELVVVGYGEQSKKKLSTAISKVTGKEINKLPVAVAGDALAGLASGVQVQAGAGGMPGEPPVIRIRGIGTLSASNTPLFVVDGYPLPNASEFSRINVADIESIEILKDAASAAIYGSRAANGVVMVTTKRGQKGAASFDFNTYTGFQQVARRMEVMNKEEYLKYARDGRTAMGLSIPDAYNNPDQLPDTDWQDQIFRTAPMSKFELAARGGSDNVRYSISGSYLRQDGTMRGTDFQLMTLRTNIDANLAPSLKIGAGFAPSYSVRNLMPTPRAPGNWSYDPIYSAMLLPPVVSVFLENGDYGQNNVMPHTQYGFSEVGVFNPRAIVDLYENRNKAFSIQNNVFLEYEVIEGLKLRSQGGVLAGTTSQEVYIPGTLASSISPFANLSTPSLAGIGSSAQSVRTIDWVWENNLTYNRRIATDHNLNAMLLYSMQKFNAYTTQTSARVGSFTNGLVHNPTASSDQIGSVGYGVNSFMSYAARLSYDYKDKYILSGSIRTDGSSRFGPDNRFGVFQSYSAAWRLTEEDFMKRQRFFNELKLRASYGETGNANIGDFTWISGMAPAHYSFGGVRNAGTAPSGFMNRNLTWEKSKQVNLGLETSFLRDRIFLSVDLYRKRTHGMLFSKELPAIVGYASSFQTNIGEIENKGIEFDINTKNTTGALKWTTSLNFSYNRTKVLDLGGRKSLNELPGTPGWNNVYRIQVGDQLGNFYGFQIDGVIRNEAQLNANPQWAGSGVGDYQIRDVNNDGVINEGDRTYLGNGLPKSLFGLTNNLTYRNFDLSFIIQGVLGNSIINGASRHTELWAGRFNTIKAMVNNYFDPANPDRDVKYARVGNRGGFSTAGNLHSYAVFNGSFLRFRNVTLGYTLPQELQKRLGLRGTRLYVSAQNLFTFTEYPGFNPEPSQYGDKPDQLGSDQTTYPVNRSFSLGLSIGF